MTRMKTPSPPDPFKAHLLAVLNLHDAATPVPRYNGPRDWQTDAILRKVEALMRKTGGTPDSEGSRVALRTTPNLWSSHRGVPCPVCGHRLLQPVDYAAERPVTASEAATTDVQEDIDTREELRLLKEQIHDISRVCSAIAVGDLTQRVTVSVQDEGMVKLKEAERRCCHGAFASFSSFFTIAVSPSSTPWWTTFGCFSTEVTRVLVDLRTGRLGSCALVDGAQGTWYNLTENVNTMSSNLTAQVRAIACVTTAIANGDLSVRVDIHAAGEMLDLKETVNEMRLRLGYFASEAEVHGAQGTWADLAENIDRMAVNLTGQIRSIGIVIREVALGNFGWMVDAHMSGEMGDIKDTLNGMVGRLQTFSSEVNRLALEVGTEGGLRRQAVVPGAQGAWGDLTENLNIMASNLTNQVRSIAHVTAAVARGDLSKRMDIDVSGEMLDLKVTVNEMVQRLDIFSCEATRVVREIGTEEKLGGEVEAEGMEGTWRDLTDNINRMARNLRDQRMTVNLMNQIRSISYVAMVAARGDLTKTITVDVRGEMQDLMVNVQEVVARLSNSSREASSLPVLQS
ncbi:hypothetical protein B0H14DRAFT_3897663 [Mycena olivaceomarginata]|nr:hypothetical protein B0H14DRAFT_3897663 [Mycena olivaceomarginata]